MTTPTPSKAQEWWNDPKYWFDDPIHEGSTLPDLPAIIRESQRLILERAKAIIERKYEKEAHLNKHCGDKPKHELCKDCLWGVNVMAEYHEILKRMSSLTNGDVENEGV